MSGYRTYLAAWARARRIVGGRHVLAPFGEHTHIVYYTNVEAIEQDFGVVCRRSDAPRVYDEISRIMRAQGGAVVREAAPVLIECKRQPRGVVVRIPDNERYRDGF